MTAGRGTLRGRMKEIAAEHEDMHFVVVVPLAAHGDGRAAAVARARLGNTLDRMRREGLHVAGMIGDPDPFTATMNALQFYKVERIIISTLPVTRSGWLRADLIARVRKASNIDVEHIVAEPEPAGEGASLMEAAGINASIALEHHDDTTTTVRRAANRSSRVSHEILGMLLFIISEIMVFGAFFTAYFFIRFVAEGHQWFPFDGFELPVAIAGVNTAILLSSSLTMHWAQTSVKNGNYFGLKAGMLLTSLLGATFLMIQINEYVHIGFSPQDFAQGTIFYGLTGLHGAHVAIGLTLLSW